MSIDLGAASPQPRKDNPRWIRALPLVSVAAVTAFTYAVTLGFGFVFDDHGLIENNGALRSWRYFLSYFTSHIWSFRYPHLLANYYRPFFLIWLRLNYLLFGLHPWGWHLTSVIAHVAVACLVYRLVLRLAHDASVATVAAFVFALHPVQAEAVSDITSAQELLSTFFLVAGVLAWLGRREAGRQRTSLVWALACYAAALLSKESGLMFLPLLAVLEGTLPAPGGSTRTVRHRVGDFLAAITPFLGVTCVYIALRIWALRGFAHTVTRVAFLTEILTIPSVLLFYIRLVVWPAPLACYYDTPYISTPSLKGVVLPGMVVLGVIAALGCWYARTRRDAPGEARLIAFGMLWMAVAIVPVLNFRLLPEGEIAHDRYLYLPMVGIAILVGVGWRQASRLGARSLGRPTGGLAAVGMLALLLGFAALRQSLYWSDDLTLNHHAHLVAPHNVYATTSFAAAAAQSGREGAAMVLYREALAARPDFWRANVNLAYLFYAHGNYQEAAHYFQRACATDPTDGDQFLYLGMSLLRLGQMREAESAIRTALLVRPNGEKYHLGLGMVLMQEGKLEEARQEVETELAEDPHNAQAQALKGQLTRQIVNSPGALTSGPSTANPAQH